MERSHFPYWRQAGAVLSAGLLALVAACGGGSGSTMAGVTPPAANSVTYSQGAIAGFGSVIVNGVRWDDSSATVTDDDGAVHSQGDLKLGMVVEINGGAVDHGTGTGRALSIAYGSEMQGPIAAIDPTAATLTVLGQTIAVTPSTVFDDSIVGGLSGLSVGQVVEVYGLFDAAGNRVVATRLEVKASATEYRLRGTVAGLDPVAMTFMLGATLIDYGSATLVPGSLANGLQVKVRMQTAQNAAGAWVATSVRPVVRAMADHNEAEVEGVVSAWTSATDFEVNGLKVDATTATFPQGSDGVVLGAQVEVKGAVVNGVLVATQVSLEDSHPGGGEHHPGREFELHGLIGSLDTTAKTFALRGVTVSYAGSVTFTNGSETQLANGARVEVKGSLSSDMTQIDATRIGFE
jgi:hypothetical protein